MLSAILNPVQMSKKVLSEAGRIMRFVLMLTAIVMAILSLGIVSPGMCLLLCLLYFFMNGLFRCSNLELFKSLGKVCVCVIAGLMFKAVGIPFFIVFLFTVFLIWVIHQ